MYTESIEVQNRTGLHARPAAVFVQAAAKFKSDISVIKDSKTVNAKSIMAVLSAGITRGNTISISATGEDEEQAVAALIDLIKSGFGEE